MKVTQTIHRSFDETLVDHMACDLCGAKSHDSRNWTDEPYHADEVQIQYKSGEYYPEGGTAETWSFDICPECWKTKLLPWMREQGATPTEEDNSY